MGFMSTLFPFQAALTATHEGAFCLNNLNALLWIVEVILELLSGTIGAVFPPLLLVTGLSALMLMLLRLVICVVASVFHLIACTRDGGAGKAFTDFSLSMQGANVLYFYAVLLDIVGLVLLVIVVGFFLILLALVCEVVAVVIALIVAAKTSPDTQPLNQGYDKV